MEGAVAAMCFAIMLNASAGVYCNSHFSREKAVPAKASNEHEPCWYLTTPVAT